MIHVFLVQLFIALMLLSHSGDYIKECNTLRGGTLSFLRDFIDRSAPSGEEAEKRKQTHVVVLRCAVCTLFEFLEQ